MINAKQDYARRKKDLEKLSFTILLGIGERLCITAYTSEELIKEILKTDYEEE